MPEERIVDETSLRDLYPPPIERARLKTLHRLDEHCRNFIAHSPFVCLGTSSERGADLAPRGDEPGFVHVLDDVTLVIPDWPGNNRLDSFSNIVTNPQVALAQLDAAFRRDPLSAPPPYFAPKNALLMRLTG